MIRIRSRVATIALLVAATVSPLQTAWSASAPPDAEAVERGRYLATAGNCISCHSRPGGEPFAGGRAFVTGFGTIYSTNITPDAETGIGRWSEGQFRRAMREGISANGDHLYPVFPYTAFTKLSDDDVRALFEYLKTRPPARHRSPENELSFPYNQRWLMTIWKALYFDAERYRPDPAKSAEWNRGAYLVEALGHCGACHSPRNFLGAERIDLALSGGTHLDKVPGGRIRTWSAVNLTSAPSGLGPWSAEETIAYLKTSLNSFATSFGPMNEVIVNSTRHLTDSDVRAIATYLKELQPLGQESSEVPDEEVMSAGQGVYGIHCGTCHLPTGKGAADTGPSMVGNPVVQSADPASLINVILYGPELPDPLPPAQRQHMEAYESRLSDDEVAALSTFMRNSWGNRAAPVSPDAVAKQR